MFSFRVGDFIARSKTKVVLYRLFHEKKVGVLGDDINSRCEKKFILTYIKFWMVSEIDLFEYRNKKLL